MFLEHSEITSREIQGTICGARDQTQAGHVCGKYLSHVLSLWPQKGCFLSYILFSLSLSHFWGVIFLNEL